jgi:hypothetical protein
MNTESNNHPREWARLLYTSHNKTIKEVALTVGVEEAAVRQWIYEGAWDTVRRSLLISKKTQLRHLYDLVDKLSAKMDDEEASTKNVDLLVKYTAAIKNLEEAISIGSMIEVSELFISWLLRRDLALAKKFTRLLDEFVMQRAAQLSL